MAKLGLASVEACIMAAYAKYLTSTIGNFNVTTDDGKVEIICAISGTKFNCGFPGYTMTANQTDQLRQWCVTHPGDGWSFGFKGTSSTHLDSVNIILIDKTQYMFNFHVYLQS